jgi:hypothetical protein
MELLISLAVSMTVLGAAVQLFSEGMDATWVLSQKAEMQQDLRAASDLLMKDISVAGSGLPTETGVALANGGGAVTPVYGCNQNGACLPTGAINYPTPPAGTGADPPTMYPIMPGYQKGITPPGSTTVSDIITVVYADPVLALPCYTVSFPNSGLNPVTFTLPTTLPSGCLPAGVAAPQQLVGSVVGLQPGDVLLFYEGSTYAVAEVTGVAGSNGTYTVTFANNDPLQLNQSGATSNDLANYTTVTNFQAMRLEVITYYLMNVPDPTGLTTGTPTLMRQVNGQTAIPVAENVVNLQFTYDTYNADGTLLSGAGDGGYSAGESFNLIRKINVLHMSIRSTLQGVRTALMTTKGYQTFDFQTSVSARNLSYQQRY